MSATAMRSHRCGSLSRAHIGQTVRLGGWVHRVRDLGGVIFLDLRDRDGLVQLSFNPDWTSPEVLARAGAAGQESVVLVTGKVELRPQSARDTGMATRDIEVRVTALEIVGPATTPAIPVARKEGEELPAEELRLKHRVLDLRRPELQKNLLMRHGLAQRARRTLSDLGFLEIETPILTKPTPEGARDYLVPSRIHIGEFYALPQSPQIYKQLLMVAGYDRYFQIARCFRDEDLRADRQPEFTQIDIEASFVSAEDVQEVVERVLVELWDQGGQPVASPFPRLTWAESMERFGIDKPDLRYEKEMQIHDFTTDVAEDSADFVRQAVASGGRLRGIVVPGGGAKFSRKDIDNLGVIAKGAKAGGLIWIKRVAAGWEGQGMKAIGASALGFSSSISKAAWADQSMLLAVVGSDEVTSPALHGIRSAAIARMGLAPSIEHAFCWIVDFPLFERDAETGQYTFAHHPFTAPHPADAGRLESDPGHCRAQHYDAVYNGMELGSGSIRITDPAIQQTVFRLLGISEPEIRRRFGFLLDGLAAGAPPHGGFAIGFDRVAMLLAGGSSLRDVIAFPKTTAARALFEGAPTAVKQEDLKALHLKVE